MNRLRTALLVTTALLSMTGVPARANPLDPVVAGGVVTIEGVGSANVTVNQTTDKAILDWRSFDIGLGEGTNFVQPDANSVVLNRVTGGEGASQILGTLTANGQVFLINPGGILIGKDAIIDVGALVASTHDIFNGDFLSGNYAFGLTGNSDASIINLGTITVADGGFAALVAPGVRNAGTITANLGKVSLASGTSFSLDLYGDDLITLGLSDEVAGQIIDLSTGKPLNALVGNDGLLRADGGTVQLTAAATRAVIDSVVNNTGVIEANSVGLRNGKIVLSAATVDTKAADTASQKVKVSGTLTASGADSGETGGKIEITGEEIELLLATLDAAGLNGGGTILVGGDVGGGDPNWSVVSSDEVRPEEYQVANATLVTVSTGTVIDASATVIGNGGKVIVWSDGSTSFEGEIAARGGAQGGDGGFVETSGHQTLAFNGSVDASAANGASGTLLLDPLNVTIGTTGANAITPTAIAAALATNNVKVTTGSSGAEAGDITVAETVSWSSANALTLSAARNIAVNSAITNSGGADINLRADDTGTGVGTISFGGTGHITTAGDVSLYFNPSVNLAGSLVNITSYAAPTENFAPYVTAATLTPHMLVNSVYDLQNIQNNLSGDYALGRDIDASSTATWNSGAGFIPLGAEGNSLNHIEGFAGILDGLGQKVTGLHIGDQDIFKYFGLFSVIGETGVVKDLDLADVTIAIVGIHSPQVGKSWVGGVAGLNQGLISNVSVAGAVEGGVVGGLVGESQGSIRMSRSTAAVTAGLDGGGLVGDLAALHFNDAQTDTLAQISDSWASGDVTTPNVGGGLVATTRGGIVSRSYATGHVTGIDAGGLVGLHLYGSIIQSHSSGSVEGAVSGGLVGELFYLAEQGVITVPSIDDSYATGDVVGTLYAGGLSSDAAGGQIDSVYTTGQVFGNGEVGGLIAVVFDAADLDVGVQTTPITASYWSSELSGQLASAGGDEIAASALKSTLPIGFDPAIWGLDSAYNGGYPYLLWERETVTAPTETVLTPDIVVPPPPPNPDPPNDLTGAKVVAASTGSCADAATLTCRPISAKQLSETLAASAAISWLTNGQIGAAKEFWRYAIFANNAYGDDATFIPLPDGWGPETEVGARSSNTGFYAESYVRYGADGKTVVEVVVAYRGTQLFSRDLITGDLPGLFGPNTQEREAQDYARDIALQYPDVPISTTGHSLGAALAKYGAQEIGPKVQAVGFDGSPLGPETNLYTNITTKLELLSLKMPSISTMVLNVMSPPNIIVYPDISGSLDPIARHRDIYGLATLMRTAANMDFDLALAE